MATILSHPAVAVALAPLIPRERRNRNFWRAAVTLSVLPDLDVLAFAFGVRYGDPWGHRGLTHSLAFAAALALAATWFCARRLRPGLLLYFFIVASSHGALDAMTDGGLGVAFFSPWETKRYFLPWNPIPVSPIGAGFFSARGWEVLTREWLIIWLPALAVFGALNLAGLRGSAPGPGSP